MQILWNLAYHVTESDQRSHFLYLWDEEKHSSTKERADHIQLPAFNLYPSLYI